MKRSLLAHYLTVAIRSIERYKTQSIISIIGLGIGFVCLTFASVWIKYENTYDDFHPGAERMYMVWDKGLDLGKYQLITEAPRVLSALCKALREQYPEVECATAMDFETHDEKSGWSIPIRFLMADTMFVHMFDVPVLYGALPLRNVVDNRPPNVAVTADYAKKRFGEVNVVDRDFITYPDFHDIHINIKGVVEAWHHSSLAFDVLELDTGDDSVDAFGNGFYTVIIRLREGAEARDLEKKLNALDEDRFRQGTVQLIPLSKAHRYMNDVSLHKMNLSYDHLQQFLLVSLLLVACVFINFLVLFLIRVRGRQREMALRMVHGARPRMLLAQFVVELLVTLAAALGVGIVLTFVLRDVFVSYACIDLTGGYVVGSALLFMAVTAAVCLVIATVSVEVVRRRTVRQSLQPGGGRRNNRFTKAGTAVQVAVSLCLICCAAFMLKQLYYMKNTDWGYDIKGHMHLLVIGDKNPADPAVPQFTDETGMPMSDEWRELLLRRLNELPYVRKASQQSDDPIGLYGINKVYLTLRMVPHLVEGDDMDAMFRRIEDEGIGVRYLTGFSDLSDAAYGLTVVEGALPGPDDWTDKAVITERTRSLMGTDHAVGRELSVAESNFADGHIFQRVHNYVVAAVVKDFYMESPTKEPEPYLLINSNVTYFKRDVVSVHYDPAHEAEMRQAVADILHELPENLIFNVVWHRDEWAELMRSEENLSRLLLVVSIVAVLVAVFGVYSIVTLACRQRRKEIALRKIHGAKLRDILGMFVREYGLILAVGAFVAFSVSYIVMHGWLEQYVKRTPLSLWVFVAIFVGTALLIALFVGSRVWRTARENPADVVKSE